MPNDANLSLRNVASLLAQRRALAKARAEAAVAADAICKTSVLPPPPPEPLGQSHATMADPRTIPCNHGNNHRFRENFANFSRICRNFGISDVFAKNSVRYFTKFRHFRENFVNFAKILQICIFYEIPTYFANCRPTGLHSLRALGLLEKSD